MTAVLTSTLIALLVIALLVNTRRPPNVNIRVADGDLVVELRAWDAIYCCRRRIQVPLQQVEGVGVYRRALIPAVGLRLPGTSLPGVIRAGSFGAGATRDFWDVRTAPEVLVIQLLPGADYRRIVVETADVRQTMHTLRPALGPLDWVPSGA